MYIYKRINTTHHITDVPVYPQCQYVSEIMHLPPRPSHPKVFFYFMGMYLFFRISKNVRLKRGRAKRIIFEYILETEVL